MPFKSPTKLFQALSDGVVPLILGGTGKKTQEQYLSKKSFVSNKKNQLSAAELQSLIARNANAITRLEIDQIRIRGLISMYWVFIRAQDENAVDNITKALNSINKYKIRMIGVVKSLQNIRKIQTKLKRQRANS
jgi:hypothetical protein